MSGFISISLLRLLLHFGRNDTSVPSVLPSSIIRQKNDRKSNQSNRNIFVNRLLGHLVTFTNSENTKRTFQRFIIQSFTQMRVRIREQTNMDGIVVATCCRPPGQEDEVKEVFLPTRGSRMVAESDLEWNSDNSGTCRRDSTGGHKQLKRFLE